MVFGIFNVLMYLMRVCKNGILYKGFYYNNIIENYN